MSAGRCFLADAMLGRLARWLRLLGWDAEYAKRAPIEELLKRAQREERILLTRRRGIAGRGVVFVESETLADQLRQLEGLYGVLSDARPFTRCPACNIGLLEAAKEEVKGRVPF